MSRLSFDGSASQYSYGHWRHSSSDSAGIAANLPIRYRSSRLGFRTGKSSGRGPAASTTGKPGLSFSSLRGTVQPELSRKLFKLIKSENELIGAHETAGRQRVSIAQQLSEWGECTGDEAISDISDKVGVILSEIGEQEDTYAHSLDDSRGILKAIRNTEKSVQPSRDRKSKIADEIQKIKLKEPESARVVVLEQELIRAEAENLVAEAQLTNITRNKLKEAYAADFAATIERSEKQIILAKHGRRLLSLLDDSPVVPGDSRPSYIHGAQARQILNDVEDDLRDWQPDADSFDSQQIHGGAQFGRGGTQHSHAGGYSYASQENAPYGNGGMGQPQSPIRSKANETLDIGGVGSGQADQVEKENMAPEASGALEADEKIVPLGV